MPPHNAHGGGGHIAHMPHIRPHLAHDDVVLWGSYDPDTWCQDNKGNWYPCAAPGGLSLSVSGVVENCFPHANGCCDSCAHGGACGGGGQASVGWTSEDLGSLHKSYARASVGGLSTTADDVRNAKLAFDPQMVATNRQWESVSLGNAANNPIFSQPAADDSFAWDQFFDSWNSFVIADSSFFGANDDMARLTDFASELQEWQTRLTADTQNSPGGPITPILRATPPNTPPEPASPLTPVVWIAGFVAASILMIEMFPFLHPRRSYRYAR